MKKKKQTKEKAGSSNSKAKGSKNWLQLKAILKEEEKGKDESKKVVKVVKPKMKKEVERKKIMDVWFDVDHEEFDQTQMDKNVLREKLVKVNSFAGLTKHIAMDCEMVGVGEGGTRSVLARVSLVNSFGHCVYDKFVKAREEVTDYRTFVSGVRPSDLETADEFEKVQKDVADILKGRVLVGHALWNDMKVLYLDHPKKNTRDTARYKPFKTMCKGRSPALRVLCQKLLGVQVQKGEHSSVTDAQATMRLYTMHKKEWEKTVKRPHLKKKALTNNNKIAKSSS